MDPEVVGVVRTDLPPVFRKTPDFGFLYTPRAAMTDLVEAADGESRGGQDCTR